MSRPPRYTKDEFQAALEAANGERNAVAEKLGISRQRVHQLVHCYGLAGPVTAARLTALSLRLNDAELALIRQRAAEADMVVSEWIRREITK